jgi:SAM-dependent methyltransferase
MTDTASSFWEQPENVDRFANRPPDKRLEILLNDYPDPAGTRVLDLGCAGGRNTELLARCGFDVYAIDASGAMVARTRARLAPMFGEDGASGRVWKGRMDELDAFDADSIDIVVALGILQSARSREEWDHTLQQVTRILKPEGRLLVANFAPGTELMGGRVVAVPDTPHVYEAPGGLRFFLLEPAEIDAEMARYGLLPVAPTMSVEAAGDSGRHVTVNAHYQKTSLP